MDILARFRSALAADLERGAVIATSGGLDSVTLAALAVRSGMPPDRLLLAHLDHALRPESASDARFVRRLAARLGLRVRVRRSDVSAEARRRGLGLEAAARRARYAFLETAALDASLGLVLTAHHRRDQEETVLLRLLRGVGPAGLAGIRHERAIRPGSPIRLGRPLLDVSRSELRAYARTHGLAYREDSTNLDGSNLRSRIRRDLLPALHGAGPDSACRLTRVAELSLQLGERWRLAAGRALEVTDRSIRGEDLPRLAPGVLREALRSALPAAGPTLDRLAMDRLATAVARGSGHVDLGRAWTARVEDRGRSLALLPPGPTPEPPEKTCVPLDCPGRAELPGGAVITSRADGAEPGSTDPLREVIDAGALGGPPLSVRFAAPGDRFRPLGLDAETTVYRFLMGQGVPRGDRPWTPVVTAGEGIVWVVGYRIDERAKVRPETRERVSLSATSRGSRRLPPSGRPPRSP